MAPGNYEYYACERCPAAFTDEAGQNETTVEEQTIAQLEHSYTGDARFNGLDQNDPLKGSHSFQCVNGCKQYGDPEECTTFKFVHTSVSCTEKAFTEKRCTVCDGVFEHTVDPDSPEPTGHADMQYHAPTCTEGGYNEVVCDHMIYVVSTSEDDIMGNYENEMECGYTERVYLEGDDQKPLGHTPKNEEWERVTQPSCLSAGLESNVCAVCGETITRESPAGALGHVLTTSFYDPAPSCNAEGVLKYRCDRCNNIVKEVEVPAQHLDEALESTLIDVDTKLPSCTEKGLTIQMCQRCHFDPAELKKDDIVMRNDGELGTVVSVNDNGTFTVDFSLMGYGGDVETLQPEDISTNTLVITETEATGHAINTFEVKQPWTCTSAGILKYSGKCSICGEDIKGEEVELPAKGHLPDRDFPTCTEPVRCKRPDCSIPDKIITPALDHDYKVPGSALGEGTEGFFCKRCGLQDNEKIEHLKALLNRVKSPTYGMNKVSTFTKTKMASTYTKFDFGIWTSAVKNMYEKEVSGTTINYEPLENASIYELFPFTFRQLGAKDSLTAADVDNIKIEVVPTMSAGTLLAPYSETTEGGNNPPAISDAIRSKTFSNVLKVTVDMKNERYAPSGSNVPTTWTRNSYNQKVYDEDTPVSKICDYDIRKIVDSAGFDDTTWVITEGEDETEYSMSLKLNYITDDTKIVYYFNADTYEPIAAVYQINEKMDQELSMTILTASGIITPIITTERDFVYLFSNAFNG